MNILIGTFYFFYFALIGIHIIFVPKILSMVGHSSLQIGVIFAAAPLVRFTLPFLFLKGFSLDKKTFYTALVILGIGAIGFYPALHSFYPLLGINIIFGIGIALILPYIEVIALEHAGREHYGRIRLFGSAGFILIALLLERFLNTPEIGIYFLIVMALITLLIGYLIAHYAQQHDGLVPSNTFSLSPYWGVWIGFLLMQVSFGPFYNFYTIYATDHGLTLQNTVWLWSIGVVIEIMMFYFQGPLLRRNLLHLLQFTALITAFRWMVVALFPDSLVFMALAQTLHAFSFTLFHTAAITFLYQHYEDKRLSQQFFYGISYGLGGFAGALGAGVLYEYAPEWLFVGSAITAVGAGIAFTKKIKFYN